MTDGIAAEKIALPYVDDDTNRLLGHLLGQLEDRRKYNALRASYYDGKRALRKITSVVPPQYYRLGIVLGWTAKAVDALARRCHLDGFVWPDGDLGSLGGAELWDGNMVGSESSQGLLESLIHGPAFMVTTKGGKGEPAALIHFKDAFSATGDWNARTRRLDNLLSILTRDDQGRVSSLALYLRNETIVAERGGVKWEVEKQEHDWGVPAELLPYKPRSARPFGQSRITRPLIGLQDQATRALIRLEGHMDVYSYPELWMLGADESIFKDSSGAVKPTWQVMLGRIKGIPDDEDAANPRADIKHIPASDPSPHLAGLNAIAKMMCREASLPDASLAITDVSNPTSAESYDSAQYELIAEAEGAQVDWTPGLRRGWMRALAIANGESEIPKAWASIDAKWRNPRFLTRAAEADAGMKQLTAVPWLADTEVGLELLGLTPQQIDRAMGERRRLAAGARLDALLAGVRPEPADADTAG